MTLIRVSAVGFVLCTLSAGPVWAQPDTTGTGGGPLTAETVPNTTAVGQTMPPSRAASPSANRPIERRTPRQAAADAISARICIGCRVEPGTTGSLPGPVSAALPGPDSNPAPGSVSNPSPGSDPVTRAPAKRDVQLDELRTLAEPRQQSDLDTRPLASAHREQAQSAQEKTDGLWQSWLVSVCEGCGNQKPTRALKLEDWPNRQAAAAPDAVDRRPHPTRVRAAEIRRAAFRPHGTLEANLSPENITGIRRMP